MDIDILLEEKRKKQSWMGIWEMNIELSIVLNGKRKKEDINGGILEGREEQLRSSSPISPTTDWHDLQQPN